MPDETRTKPSSYFPAPLVPKELQPRLTAILQVLTHQVPETVAAKQTGLSRHYFQTLKNRALQALIECLEPRPAGRPSQSPEEGALKAEVTRLRKENARLQERVAMVDRMLAVTSDLMNGRVRLSGRQKGAAKAAAEPSHEPEEPDGAAAHETGVDALKALGLRMSLIAALLGVGESTLRRRCAQRQTRPDAAPHTVREATSPVQQAHLDALLENEVRHFHGLIGEEALRRKFGVSRRYARAVKASAVTRMEVERVRQARRITIVQPGIVRGFDAMHVLTTAGWRYLLVVGDSAVCFRTTVEVSETYDGRTVADVLERDFRQHGAPLFLRMDRAKCHTAPEVRAVLARHGVMLLQGPARHPRYYGQLGRQNRELRAWLNTCGVLSPAELSMEVARMTAAWNSRLPRRTLGWQTAEERWRERPAVSDDRAALANEVQDRAARIQQQLDARRARAGMATRFAIEATLKQRGWMTEEQGGWC